MNFCKVLQALAEFQDDLLKDWRQLYDEDAADDTEGQKEDDDNNDDDDDHYPEDLCCFRFVSEVLRYRRTAAPEARV